MGLTREHRLELENVLNVVTIHQIFVKARCGIDCRLARLESTDGVDIVYHHDNAAREYKDEANYAQDANDVEANKSAWFRLLRLTGCATERRKGFD
jgi:hypothetical protein